MATQSPALAPKLHPKKSPSNSATGYNQLIEKRRGCDLSSDSGKRTKISSNSTFEEEFAYSRIVADGRWVMVSGTTGYDYNTMTISADPAKQAAQCFENIKSALSETNATLEDIVRVRYLVPDRSDVSAFAPVFQQYLGNIRPAATLMVTQLLNTDMKIEIEVTALRAG